MIIVILVNFSLFSCTEENLVEVLSEATNVYADSGGEDDKKDPVEEPPGGVE